MHERLGQQLERLDRLETAERAKCRYLAGDDRFLVLLLNTEYVVDIPNRQIIPAEDDYERVAHFCEQLCILGYLTNATTVPPAKELVSAERLDAGQFFFRGTHTTPTRKLEEAFGRAPALLYGACRDLNAGRCSYGDASVEFSILPRIPLTLVIWGADIEFPARASIILDRSAPAHLPLDVLWAALGLAVDKVVSAAHDNEETRPAN
ncbi:MAG: DUF3786 domain-containing protein [Phycisphaerales bacterium]|nr:MAG: DUF3786 domain-containing protein [Phycisphaerales bacterium]